MDRGAWWATVRAAVKSQTWLSVHTQTDKPQISCEKSKQQAHQLPHLSVHIQSLWVSLVTAVCSWGRSSCSMPFCRWSLTWKTLPTPSLPICGVLFPFLGSDCPLFCIPLTLLLCSNPTVTPGSNLFLQLSSSTNSKEVLPSLTQGVRLLIGDFFSGSLEALGAG